MTYDTSNIFARMLRKEIPVNVIYENEFALSFYDIAPASPVHALIICKYPATSYDDFIAHAPDADITGFFKAVAHVASLLDVVDTGYRLITNHGSNASQTVAHFHVHLLAGKALGRLLSNE